MRQPKSTLFPYTTLFRSLEKLADDYPFIHTLRFVEVAGIVKDSGLKVEDLDYLFRHRIDDAAGKYRPNPQALLSTIRALANGIRSIRAEHSVPTDPTAVTEELLRRELGL